MFVIGCLCERGVAQHENTKHGSARLRPRIVPPSAVSSEAPFRRRSPTTFAVSLCHWEQRDFIIRALPLLSY